MSKSNLAVKEEIDDFAGEEGILQNSTIDNVSVIKKKQKLIKRLCITL